MSEKIKPIDNVEEKISSQIVHEAEITRQNTRYKIPAKMEIDGKIYKLRDWSLTGCSIIDLPKEYLNRHTTGKMIFKFDQFETIVDNLKIEFLYKKENYIGCCFTNLTPQQISILNQIITAYVNGDIITQDDIITAVTKIQMYPKKKKIDEVEKKKAKLILLLIFTTLATIIIFLSYIVYKKVFIIDSVNGYVDSNITTLRSPYPSFINFQKNYQIDQNISNGETVALAYLVGGGISRIVSPIDGKILKIYSKNSEFANTGEPIISIIDANATQYIHAIFFSKETKKIKTGYIAKIIINSNIYYGKIIKILYPEDAGIIKSKPNENIYANPRNFIDVIIIPLRKIDKKFIGSSVYVRLDTFVNKLGFIDEKNSNNFFTSVF